MRDWRVQIESKQLYVDFVKGKVGLRYVYRLVIHIRVEH